MIINRSTEITGNMTESIQAAAAGLLRDIEKVFLTCDLEGGTIELVRKEQKAECFCLKSEGNRLKLYASDDLGFIYGIYEISRTWLGIGDFWFWNDQAVQKKEAVEIPENYCYQSTPFAVRYRGWFINDEVLLHTWSVDRNKDKPWEMVFETLLRCGGNLVIPGTDRNSVIYRSLAAKMGLYITHHHAEPLGAEMFARAYPKLQPSYDKYPDQFRKLWQEGIQCQKDFKVIWNLGFRGQGDRPFWEDDPKYATAASRGELLNQLIRIQYDMVKKADPQAVCCTNLYGETMELYREGYLRLPEDVIKIWADNGYGKMVTRRQGNHNLRIEAMPEKSDRSCHGIYYHVSFYDLQAANHMTMLPNSPEFVKEELERVLEYGMKEFWLVNCSNIKPHVYYLDFIAEIWRKGKVSAAGQRKSYAEKYFGSSAEKTVSDCIKDYFSAAVSYGPNKDDHAGEQFTNHVSRILIHQFMNDRSRPSKDLLWAANEKGLKEQNAWYKQRCREGTASYGNYLKKCERATCELEGSAEILFRDSILLQARLHYHCFRGALQVCESLEAAFAERYKEAFYLAGKARKEYLSANRSMRDREHGKWNGFYANECLTDMKQTAWVLEALMGFLRTLGEGPHYYEWQREFLYSEEDRQVMLILNMENHLNNDELFRLMEERKG